MTVRTWCDEVENAQDVVCSFRSSSSRKANEHLLLLVRQGPYSQMGSLSQHRTVLFRGSQQAVEAFDSEIIISNRCCRAPRIIVNNGVRV